jgi:coronin-7
MKAEINRAVVLGTADAVIPIPLEVPRRQYIDFHADLFPATLARTPGQTAAQWIAGGDAMVELVEQDPKRKTSTSARAPAPTAVASVTSAPPTSLPAPPRVEAAMKALSLAPTPTPSPSPSPAVAPTPLISKPLSSVTPVRAAAPAVTPSGPFNPSWSRKFLTGKTPLKPDYYDLHGLSTTMGADVQLIKVSAPRGWVMGID